MLKRPLLLALAFLLCATFVQAQTEVTLHTMTAPSARWFEWETWTTASWVLPHRPNRYDFEVWIMIDSSWLRWQSVPSGRGRLRLEIPESVTTVAFRLWHRRQHKNIGVPVVAQSIASASFMPPPNGSAWVWEEDQFVLRRVIQPGRNLLERQ